MRARAHPHTSDVVAFLEALHRCAPDQRDAMVRYTTTRLIGLRHPCPEAWFIDAALYALGTALRDAPFEQAPRALSLGMLASALTAHDPFGAQWAVACMDHEGALLEAVEASSLDAPHTTTQPRADDPDGLHYSRPALELWWRGANALWAYGGPARPSKVGTLAADPDGDSGHFTTGPLVSALLCWELSSDAMQRADALRAWDTRRFKAPRAQITRPTRRIASKKG